MDKFVGRKFIGRKHQLRLLTEELALVRTTGEGRFVWMHGHRRIGKSRLAQQLVEAADAPYLFFQASRRPRPDGLDRFVDALADSPLPGAGLVRRGARADTWRAALELAACDATPERPVIVVIDELSHLIERDRGVAAGIREAWDRELRRRAVLLVCIGSDLSMMQALIEHPAELFGRPTREMPVQPFSPRDVGALTQVGAAEAFDRYLIVGGLPQLVCSWPHGLDRRAHLERTLADPASPLVVDGLRILDAELPRELQARDVLEAIGHGERTFVNISRDSGVTNHSSLNNALRTLERKGLIEVELPFPTGAGRHKRYLVADPYLRFWLRFVAPHIDEIDRGRSDLLLARIERDWRAFSGVAIEPIVRRSIERLLPDRRLRDARCVGGYWTRSGTVEVDLVGAPSLEPRAISFVGSVKWREGCAFGREDVRDLIVCRGQVPRAEGSLLVGVSRAGFESGTGLDVALGADDLLDAWPEP
jgi:uncharacterized protein